MVTVRIPNALRKYTARAEYVDVEGPTIDEALLGLVVEHPDLRIRVFDESGNVHPHLMVFHEGLAVAPDQWPTTTVTTRDQITVLIAISGGVDDVRMRGFRERATVAQARAAALLDVAPLPSEGVGLAECAGRTLASDVRSEINVPPFRRATMDGFAVCAQDTYGASAYDPVILDLIGSSMPGRDEGDPVSRGLAGRIMTGAPVQEGANAVLARTSWQGPRSSRRDGACLPPMWDCLHR